MTGYAKNRLDASSGSIMLIGTFFSGSERGNFFSLSFFQTLILEPPTCTEVCWDECEIHAWGGGF